MKKLLYITFFFCTFNGLLAQTVPIGLGLRDVNPDIIVGATLQSGMSDAQMVTTVNSCQQNVFLRDFNLGQATCYPAWETWKGLKKYDFTAFNKTINWLLSKDRLVAAHLLVGPDNYFPEWFKTGTFSKNELDSLMFDYIKSAIISNENNRKVEYWNVVNETLAPTTHYYDNLGKNLHCKFQKLGMEPDKSGLTGADKVNLEHPVYIRKAFEYARKYTNKKLELRDYGIEFWDEGKSKAFYQLVKHLINSGTPIDAVGLQGHFNLNNKNDWHKLTEAILRYESLGLEVYITEIDLADKTNDWSTDKALKQRKEYALMMKAIVEANPTWICFWGLRDNWNKHWLYDKHPLLYDYDFNQKPAYYGVQEGLLSLDPY